MGDDELVLTPYRLDALRAKGCVIEHGRVARQANDCWLLHLVVEQPDGEAELWSSSMISQKKAREFASLSAVVEHAKRVGLLKLTIDPPAYHVIRNGWR